MTASLPSNATVGGLPGDTSGRGGGGAAIRGAKQARERLVLLSMGLATAALAATLYSLFEFSLATVASSAGVAWATLMLLHFQVSKTAEIVRLKEEIEKLRGASAVAPATATDHATVTITPPSARKVVKKPADGEYQPGDAKNIPAKSEPRDAPSSEAANLAASQNPLQAQARWVAPPQSSSPRAGTPVHNQANSNPQIAIGPRSVSTVPDLASTAPAARSIADTAQWPGTAISSTDPMRDQWAFRPNAVVQPTATLAKPSGMQSHEGSRHADQGATIDADLEMVQRKIKAMADEVNGAGPAWDKSSGQAGNRPVSVSIEQSIVALRATAETMRDKPQAYAPEASAREERVASGPTQAPSTAAQLQPAFSVDLLIPATAQTIASSEPAAQPQSVTDSPAGFASALPHLDLPSLPPLPAFEFAKPFASDKRLAEAIAAIEAGSMDVLLSPIVALQSHQVSHYDITIRLRSTSGADFKDADEVLQLASNDVLALFDIARLTRAATLAQKLDAHNKPGSLLSMFSGSSVTNSGFLEAFARAYEERDGIASQLVLTFSQSDTEQFSPSAWQALSDMQAFGFRFALSKIDHVSTDFAGLARRGFAFIKLDADAFMNGLPARDRFVAPDEICAHLARSGMTIVTEAIDNEAVRARIFGFGVLYGQGQLFGGTRQVKLDPLASGSSAAA